MGCGASKDDEEKKKGSKKKDDKYQDNSPKQEERGKPASDVEDDPDDMAPIARKESHAVSADEPGGLVAKVKQMYNVRKAKFNGANEDVDQYQDEIQESIPMQSKKDKNRINEWVKYIADCNPAGFEEMPADGMQPKPPQQQAADRSSDDPGVLSKTTSSTGMHRGASDPLLSPSNGMQRTNTDLSGNPSGTNLMDLSDSGSRVQPPAAIPGAVPSDDEPPAFTPARASERPKPSTDDKPAADGDEVPELKVTNDRSGNIDAAEPGTRSRNRSRSASVMSGIATPQSHGLVDLSESRTRDESSAKSDHSAVMEDGDFKM